LSKIPRYAIVVPHLENIYKSGELEEISATEYFSIVRQEGKRKVRRVIKFYNLDAIISICYRVNLINRNN
jgi:hypothetical protein